MIRYTANYMRTNSNFVFQNIVENNSRDEYYPAICILKNILQRGYPTGMSDFLISKIGKVNLEIVGKRLIDSDWPIWIKTIRGDNINNYFPARTFYDDLIPRYLPQFCFIKQLILPEAYINEITGIESDRFVDQRVDFYLPQAKLVIEIDGQQHKINDVNRINDTERDRYLRGFGIETIRIKTKDLESKNDNFDEKIRAIELRITSKRETIEPYNISLTNIHNGYNIQKFLPVAVIRFQMLVLTLLENNYLNFNDRWNFRILQRDVKDFAEIAIEDLFLWLENLCQLLNKDFVKPEYNVVYAENESEFRTSIGFIDIDFSVLKRWTDENERIPDRIYVRGDYFDDKNYFEVSTAKPVDYDINTGDEGYVAALKFLLKNIFGFEEFNEGQLPIIVSALRGEHTIGILPTGGGKSLCYQFAALLQPSISFVVCPTKALMMDQKENLDKKYVDKTNFINSSQTPEEKELIMKSFGEGKYLLIWISPERFQSRAFRGELNRINNEKTIALAIIDEVHCLSEWGHGFKTSYLTLIKTIKSHCPTSRLLGLTATASRAVIKDLIAEFKSKVDGMYEDETVNIKLPLRFTRDELHFKLIKDNGNNNDKKYENLVSIMGNVSSNNGPLTGSSGIIFTPHVNGDFGCYPLAGKISNQFNINVGWFSGTVPTRYRQPIMNNESFQKAVINNQISFMNNDTKLLVATKAFGMGIDKSDVRYTIHYGMPMSAEQLYQEAGRAGRDRKASNCYVLYSKEMCSEKIINKLFDRDADLDDINEVVYRIANGDGRINGRDIYRNMFLWLSNVRGIDFEVDLAKKIYNNYAQSEREILIGANLLGQNNQDVERAIYRLSLLGIIEDWTVENYGERNGKYLVKFCNYNDQSILNRLLGYIKRYDTNFTLDFDYISTEEYGKYIKIFNSDNLSFIEKNLKILVSWIYDNIVYQRRQALKTLYDLCENFTDGESFKRILESYFIYNEKTVILDHISEHPDDYKSWFKVFYDEEHKKQIDFQGVVDLSNAIKRFLETYRYNLGLDYLSGLTDLMVNKYPKSIKIERFEDAFLKIKKQDKQAVDYILNETYKIAHFISQSENRSYLGYCILKIFPDRLSEVYENLEDMHSSNLILKNSIKRLEAIKRRVM